MEDRELEGFPEHMITVTPAAGTILLGSGDELGHGAFGLYIKEALIKCDCGFLPWQAKNLAGNLRTRRKILCFIYTAYKGRNR